MNPSRRHSNPSPCKEPDNSPTVKRSSSSSSSKNSSSRSKTPELPPQASTRFRRKTKTQIEGERIALIEDAVRNNREDGLVAREIPNKGRGIFSTKEFKRGDFIVEYAGDLIRTGESRFREQFYGCRDTSGSSYMFYFKHNGEMLCVDATEDRGRLGRLTNHSRKCNMIIKVWNIDKIPRLLLMAKCDIPIGVELTVDYGDRSKAALENFGWLRE